MRTISKEINLDVSELGANENSIFYAFYGNENFIYDKEEERYSVDKLMKLGFLTCQH